MAGAVPRRRSSKPSCRFRLVVQPQRDVWSVGPARSPEENQVPDRSTTAPTMAPPHASRAELGAIVEALSADLDAVSARLTDAIHRHLGELEEDLRVGTLQSVRANMGLIVTMLREGTPPSTAEAPPEALAY